MGWHLPRNVTLELHQVLHLPRNVTLELHQVLHLPRNVTLELYQVLRLPKSLLLHTTLTSHDSYFTLLLLHTTLTSHDSYFTLLLLHTTLTSHYSRPSLTLPASKHLSLKQHVQLIFKIYFEKLMLGIQYLGWKGLKKWSVTRP